MKMLRTGLALVFCLVVGPAHADIRREVLYERLELDSIAVAKTSAVLGRRFDEIARLRRSESACEWQLAADRLPYSCYAAERVARDLRIKRPMTRQLDEKCETIARITDETQIAGSPGLPPRCLQLAKVRVRVNRYKLGKDFD